MIPINYIAVVVAAIVNVFLGFLWFGPLFGKKWMKLADMPRPEAMTDAQKKSMMKSYILMAIGSLVMATVLSWIISLIGFVFGIVTLSAGIIAALVIWIGFVAPITMGVVLWDRKSWTYWWITYSYYLVGFLIMGGILALWR